MGHLAITTIIMVGSVTSEMCESIFVHQPGYVLKLKDTHLSVMVSEFYFHSLEDNTVKHGSKTLDNV